MENPDFLKSVEAIIPSVIIAQYHFLLLMQMQDAAANPDRLAAFGKPNLAEVMHLLKAVDWRIYAFHSRFDLKREKL